MADYIPRSDTAFDEWLEHFTAYVVVHSGAIGLSGEERNQIIAQNNSWDLHYDAHITAKAAARGAQEMKDNAREDAESLVRKLARIATAHTGTTDADREGLGITVPDTTPTPLSEDVVLATPPPIVLVDHSQPRMAIVHFGANPGNERENAKPPGIKGAKIWYHIGGLPAEGEKWEFLADDTNSPYTHVINNDESLTVAYRAQYFDRRLRLGPLGDPMEVAISA